MNLSPVPKQPTSLAVETVETTNRETGPPPQTQGPLPSLSADDLLAFFCPDCVAGLPEKRDEATAGSAVPAATPSDIARAEALDGHLPSEGSPAAEMQVPEVHERQIEQTEVVVAQTVTGPWETAADRVTSPELEMLLNKLQEAQRQLQAASYRIGCLEHQISKHEESRLLLPDLEAQAARAAALARENDELRKLVPYLEARANRLPVVQRENEELRRRLDDLKSQKSKAWWVRIVRFLTGRRGARAVQAQEGGGRFAGRRRDREGGSRPYNWAEEGRMVLGSQYEVLEARQGRR